MTPATQEPSWTPPPPTLHLQLTEFSLLPKNLFNPVSFLVPTLGWPAAAPHQLWSHSLIFGPRVAVAKYKSDLSLFPQCLKPFEGN